MKIGKQIKHLRELRGMTQASLADGLGISQKQISRIETDTISPSLDTISSISQLLEVRLQELLDLDTEKIINSITHHQSGDYTATYHNGDTQKLEALYERLLAEKEQMIQMLLRSAEKQPVILAMHLAFRHYDQASVSIRHLSPSGDEPNLFSLRLTPP